MHTRSGYHTSWEEKFAERRFTGEQVAVKRQEKIKRLRREEAAQIDKVFVWELPAVAAIAPVAAISAIATSTASAAATMTPTATAATSTEAPTAASTAALLLRTCFIDDEVTAAEVLAVHGIDSAVGFFVIGDFDESETARLTSEAIANEIDSRGINACLGKKVVQRILRSGKRKIANVKLLH